MCALDVQIFGQSAGRTRTSLAEGHRPGGREDSKSPRPGEAGAECAEAISLLPREFAKNGRSARSREPFGFQRDRRFSPAARSTRRDLKMASSWSRMPWTSLARASGSRVQRLAVLVFAERLAGARTFHSRQPRQQQHGETAGDGAARKLLTCTALVSAAGLGYALYTWRNDLRRRAEGLALPNCPVVHAISSSDGNQNRDKYNFIADVVEISAPAVVYIEIRDNNR